MTGDNACPICGQKAILAFKDMRDRQYDAAPTATYYRCLRGDCRHLFVSPPTREEDLLSLYASYSTHADSPIFPKSMRARVYQSLTVVFGLPDRLGSQIDRWRLMDMQGRSGSVLDVGCGSGNLLKELQKTKSGRNVGIDFDPKAIEAAKSNGIDARVSTIEEVSDGPYDNLLLNHVIEHVPDPLAFLKTAYEKIKCGGVAIIRTPNSNSRLARRFGDNWRGLEPPRHLHIFTVPSLRAVAKRAGFEVEEITSANAMLQGIYFESARLKAASGGSGRRGTFHSLIAKLAFPGVVLMSSLARKKDDECGEEVVAILRRP